MRKIIVSALTAFSLTALAAPAIAESISVPYGDLNLASAAGRATLDSRVLGAAKRICARASPRDVHDGIDQQVCMRAVQASATIQVARATGKDKTLALNSVTGR